MISAAYAQSGGSIGPGFDFLIPIVLIFVIMWFLVIRPQQRRVKEHKRMVEAVRRGDIVVTSGGIVGKVTRVFDNDTDEILVEVAEGVRVRVIRGTLSDVRAKTEPANDKSNKSN